jgi:hypothetical protein
MTYKYLAHWPEGLDADPDKPLIPGLKGAWVHRLEKLLHHELEDLESNPRYLGSDSTEENNRVVTGRRRSRRSGRGICDCKSFLFLLGKASALTRFMKVGNFIEKYSRSLVLNLASIKIMSGIY